MSSTKLNRIIVQHLDGERKGDLETFVQTTVSIGRSGDCDLVFVNEKSTSIYHAVLRQRQDCVELLDTQSTNGTFLNDVRVERAVLKDGDVVRFGVLGPKVKICLAAGRDVQAPVNPSVPSVPQTNAGSANPPDALPPLPLAPAEDPTDEPVNHWRMVRTALMFYAGGSVAAIGVVNTVIDLYQLDVRWFSVFLIFMGGGVVSTAVEAWYRATPGTQKIQRWEVLVHLLLIASCVGVSALLWR